MPKIKLVRDRQHRFSNHRNAKNFKLIQIDLEKPAEANWVDLVPDQEYYS
jgi:hypothetical protein